MKEIWYALKGSDPELIESAIAHAIVTGSMEGSMIVNKPFVAPFSHKEFLTSLEVERSATVFRDGYQTENSYKL